MKAQHTPGPWFVAKESDSDSTNYTVIFRDGGIESHVAVCHYWSLAEEHGELVSNARLIAAAPDMLEALEKLLLYHSAPSPIYYAQLTEKEIHAQARAAIAKAKGQAI